MDYEQGLDEQDARPKSTTLPPEVLDTDFKRRYPPDPLGKEMDDSARVWKVFRDEATAHDSSMLDGWNKTLDILLIFAGLFSAVATAFIIESYKLLQPDDSADYTAMALYALVFATNNTAALSILPAPPTASARSTSSSRWINGLFFTSLFLSLAVALLCILVKQWLGEYTARTTASASNRLWARRRMFYFDGLDAWHLSTFVSVLPLLLHLALFLFFGGLVAFLWALDRGIGAWLATVSVCFLLTYILSLALPAWRPECPTSTPLVNQMRKAVIALKVSGLRLCIAVFPHIQRQAHNVQNLVHRYIRHPRLAIGGWPCLIQTLQRTIKRLTDNDEKLLLHAHLDAHQDEIESAALHWLILSVSDDDAVAVGLQAIGALRPWSSLARLMRSEPILHASTFERQLISTVNTSGVAELTRITRSILCLFGEKQMDYERGVLGLNFACVRGDRSYPDVRLLSAALSEFGILDMERLATDGLPEGSPSLTSTAVLLLNWVTPGNALRALLCVRLEEFSPEDWVCAFHALRWTPAACPRHTRRPCNSLTCRADSLAQMLSEKQQQDQVEPDYIDNLARLIEHALSASDRTDDIELVYLPYLVEFMASDLCLMISFSELAVQRLRLTLRRPDYRMVWEPTAVSALNRAVPNILHITLHQNIPDYSRGLMGAWISRIYLHQPGFIAFGHSEMHSLTGSNGHCPAFDTSSLVALLQLFLERPENSKIQACIWEMLSELRGYHWYPVQSDEFTYLELAVAISGALCALFRRGVNPAAMVDAFFSLPPTPFLVHLRYAHHRSRVGGMVDTSVVQFIYLARHCAELRPAWWFTLANNVADIGDVELVEFTRQVGVRLSQQGQCWECPNKPRGGQLLVPDSDT